MTADSTLKVFHSRASIPTWLVRLVLHMQGRGPQERLAGTQGETDGSVWSPRSTGKPKPEKDIDEISDLPLTVDLVQCRPCHSLLSPLSRPELHSSFLFVQGP